MEISLITGSISIPDSAYVCYFYMNFAVKNAGALSSNFSLIFLKGLLIYLAFSHYVFKYNLYYLIYIFKKIFGYLEDRRWEKVIKRSWLW